MSNAKHTTAQRNMQRRFDRLTERAPVRQIGELFDREVDTATRAATQRGRGRRAATFSAADQRQMLTSVRGALRTTGRALAAEVEQLGVEAHADSFRGLLNYMGEMEGRRLSIDTPSNIRVIQRARRVELERTVNQLVARNMGESMQRVTEALREARARGASFAEAQQTMQDVLAAERYRFERIVRTETAHAYNAGQYDGIHALRAHYPDIMSRWVEHVSDTTWEPLDARVAKDSIALHGQVVLPGGSFTMPNDASVPSTLWGKQWDFPPNRPNDRAVIAPWRRAWGVPAWKLRGTSRQWLVRR